MSSNPSQKRTQPRSASTYPRKRATQACYVCRSRKSRCDGIRPTCGFCQKTGIACTYSSTDVSSLDPASLIILERIGTLENNLRRELLELNAPFHILTTQSPESANSSNRNVTKTTSLIGFTVINGDSMLKWPVMVDLLQEHLEHCDLSEDDDRAVITALLDSSATKNQIVSLESSSLPKIQSYGKSLNLDPSNNDVEASAPSDATKEIFISYYFSYVHSKSPIFDKSAFEGMVKELDAAGWEPSFYLGPSLALGIPYSTICLYLLVLALGHITHMDKRGKHNLRLSSLYFEYAQSWFGPMLYTRHAPRSSSNGALRLSKEEEDLRKIQCVLLMGSYFMWTMKPWDAWHLFGDAARLSRELTLNVDTSETSSHGASLRFRVCWACAKAERELGEEIENFESSKDAIANFSTLENLPSPPNEEELDENQQENTTSDAWFYYLSDMAGRKLLNRIYSELYQALEYTPNSEGIAPLYKIAEELDRQIQEWFISLGVIFRTQPHASTTFDREELVDEHYRHLKNRLFQCRMAAFKPFLKAVVQLNSLSHDFEGNSDHILLQGAIKCVMISFEFLQAQGPPRRHYGTWLLGRNMWSASLILVIAMSIATLRDKISQEDDSIVTPGSYVKSPDPRVTGSLLERMGSVIVKTTEWLEFWGEVSPSLNMSAKVLKLAVDGMAKRKLK